MYRILVLGSALLALAMLAPSAALAQDATPALPSPPSQPVTGPGGIEAPFERAVTTRVDGEAGGFWLVEPAAPATPDVGSAPLPLVLFLSGCCDDGVHNPQPTPYQAWIDHTARRGAVVLYPAYRFATSLDDVITAVREALVELATGGHVPVDRTRFAVIGHSWGGILAVNLAAVAGARGLPVPSAVLSVEPGCINCGNPLEDLGAIPPQTLILVVVGDRDTIVADVFARAIWAQLAPIPVDRRDYVTFVSDDHGAPPLVADHFFPGTDAYAQLPHAIDVLDWFGTWKLSDALTACAFADEDCETALGNTPRQRFMGVWSDGVPVAEPRVTDDPTSLTSD